MVIVKFGDKLSDAVSNGLGTWKFISILTAVTAAWIAWNVYAPKNKQFDPFPFIGLNLCYSFLAAYTAPILLMSANRQAESDRKRAIENLTIDRMDHAHIDSMLHKMKAIEESLVEAVRHREEVSSRQPKAICSDCGSKWGLWYKDGNYIGPTTHFSTYKTAPCDVCGKVKPCTEAKDYGELRIGWKRKV